MGLPTVFWEPIYPNDVVGLKPTPQPPSPHPVHLPSPPSYTAHPHHEKQSPKGTLHLPAREPIPSAQPPPHLADPSGQESPRSTERRRRHPFPPCRVGGDGTKT